MLGLLNEVQYVDNANEEIDALHRIDPAKTAVVDKKFSAEVKSAAETDTLSTIKLTAYEPNDLKYEVNSKTGGTVVFSEIYYPGWQAYIDGVERRTESGLYSSGNECAGRKACSGI